jgi:hypothetical protein
MPRGGRRSRTVRSLYLAERLSEAKESPPRPCHRCKKVRPQRHLLLPLNADALADYAMCNNCYRLVVGLWVPRGADPKKANAYYRKLYKITLEEYGALFFAQCGVCAICSEPASPDKVLVVDHDHETGKVRGLLCGTCNSAIGLLKDDTEVIVQAALYLYRTKLGVEMRPVDN